MSYTLLSNWILVSGLLALFPALIKLGPKPKLAILASIPVVLLIPLNQISFSGYIHTLTAQLSISSMALMAAFVARKWFQVEWLAEKERRGLLFALALFSPIFFYTALGFTRFDLYTWGFAGNPAIYLLIALALIAFSLNYQRIALIVALVVVAPFIPIGESNNAWDYLIDTWLAIYALGWSLVQLMLSAWRYRTEA